MPNGDERAARKFDTYSYYLQCVANVIEQEHGDWQHLAEACLQSTRRLQGIGDFEGEWVERHMRMAWNTEFLISAATRDPSLLQLSNQWIPIQAYYTVYAACEAAGYVLDGEQPGSHRSALRKMTNYFGQSGLTPWNKAFAGALGRTGSGHSPVNFPPDIDIPHNLERGPGVDPLGMFARCMRATHKWHRDETWDRNSGFKYACDPGKTSLLHFLHRLRIEANYREIDAFVQNAPRWQAERFAESLALVCSATLLYLEVVLMRKCRKAYLLAIGERYLELNPSAEKLRNRLDFYRHAA